MNKNWLIFVLQTQKGSHKALSKEAFFYIDDFVSAGAGWSIADNFNRQIWLVNESTSVFVQSILMKK